MDWWQTLFMGWRELIGNALMKLTDALPEPAPGVVSDPLNYVVQGFSQSRRRTMAERLADVQQAFPALAHPEAETIMQQVTALQQLAFDLAGQVNSQRITQDEAMLRIKQAFPQIDRENAAKVLGQNLVDTR